MVTNTSAKESSAAGAIGILIGAAALKIAEGKKPKEDTNPNEEKPKNEKASK